MPEAKGPEPKDPMDTPATPDAIFGKEAVAAALADHAAIQGLQQFITDAKWDRGELTLTVAPETIVQACEAAKAAGYNFFEDVTAVDWYPNNSSGAARFPAQLFPALARAEAEDPDRGAAGRRYADD